MKVLNTTTTLVIMVNISPNALPVTPLNAVTLKGTFCWTGRLKLSSQYSGKLMSQPNKGHGLIRTTGRGSKRRTLHLLMQDFSCIIITVFIVPIVNRLIEKIKLLRIGCCFSRCIIPLPLLSDVRLILNDSVTEEVRGDVDIEFSLECTAPIESELIRRIRK